jgi:hypothetical protein
MIAAEKHLSFALRKQRPLQIVAWSAAQPLFGVFFQTTISEEFRGDRIHSALPKLIGYRSGYFKGPTYRSRALGENGDGIILITTAGPKISSARWQISLG